MVYVIFEIHNSDMVHNGGLFDDDKCYQWMTRIEGSYASYVSVDDAMDTIRKHRNEWKNKTLTILPIIDVPWDENEEIK